jgi:two-component system, NarL family, sensor histidine kinase DevS
MLAAFGVRVQPEDRRLLGAFAPRAATAVGTARRVEEQRLRDSMQAAEEERKRWARELHDDTLQALGALRLLLAGARRAEDPDRLRTAVDQAVARLEEEIAGLRGLVRELRPAALDELSVDRGPRRPHRLPPRRRRPRRRAAAGRLALCARGRDRALPDRPGGAHERRAKLRRAASAGPDRRGRRRAARRDRRRRPRLRPRGAGGGLRLAGKRERVALLYGELEIASSEGGTRIAVALPLNA